MKRCSSCKCIKNPSEFNKNKAKIDGLQNCCRQCTKINHKKYYNNNKQKHKEAVSQNRNRYRQENQKFIVNYLLQNPCVDCGEKDPCCLEFDHVRGKKYKSICTMLKVGNSLKKIKDEITKCDVRCANCHAKKTAKEQSWYKYEPKPL